MRCWPGPTSGTPHHCRETFPGMTILKARAEFRLHRDYVIARLENRHVVNLHI
jgi:hypothetical protein